MSDKIRNFLKTIKSEDIDTVFDLAVRSWERGDKVLAKLYLKGVMYWDKVAFACVVLPHHVPDAFGRHHIKMLDRIPPGLRGVQHVDAAPRGHAKTTARGTIEVTHDICFKDWHEAMGFMADTYIGVISETTDLSEAHLHTIKGEIEDNEALRFYFGNLVGQPWGVTLFRAKNGVWCERFSRGSAIRGKKRGKDRLTKVIGDDVESTESVQSPEQREKVRQWYQTDVRRAGVRNKQTNFLWVGTYLHQDALLPSLVDNPGYTSDKYKAVISWATNEKLWQAWRAIYTDLSNPSRFEDARKFYEQNETAMLSGVEMLWEEGFSYYEVQEAIISDGLYAVMKELQNEPYDPERQIFDMENAVTFEVTDEGLLRSDKRLALWDNIIGASLFLDWAGGKDVADNCYACAVIMLWERFPLSSESYMYLLDCWMARGGYTTQIEACFDLHAKYSTFQTRYAIEDIPKDITRAIHDAFRTSFNETKTKRAALGKPHELTLEFLPRTQNKLERIASLEPDIQNGWLAFNKTLRQDFMDQFIQFPTHEYLDGPDATEGARQIPVTKRKDKIPKRRTLPRVRL